MNTQLRRASAKDAGAIRRLIWSVRINPSGLDWRRFWLIVDEQNHLLACGQIKPHRDGIFELASIAVDPASRGQGLARQVIQHLQQQQSAPLYLTCRPALIPFYAQFGFFPVAETDLPLYFRRMAAFFHLLRHAGPSILRWDGSYNST